jgi:prophage antirepressor-like protein
MLNLFKSPKKETSMIQNDSSLLVRQFNGLKIKVYGTFEEPLFKAKDIGDLLGMSNIRETIKGFNHKQKVVSLTDTLGGQQDVTFLTEQGLYKVLMRSRKKIAEQFQDWVCEVVEEIRKKGKYDLQEKLKEKEIKELEYKKQIEAKEQELLKYKEKTYEEIEKTGHLYVIKTDGGTKVGKTKDCVSKRIKGLQTGNVNNIEIILDFPTSNPDLLEKCVHYILDRYRCNSNREFFDCDVNYINTIVNVCGTVIDTLKSTYQHISKEELVDKLIIICNNGIELEFGIDETTILESSEVCDFYNWLEENIQYSENPSDYIELKPVCELFLNKTPVSTKLMSKYRKEIEKYVKEKYKNNTWKYDQLWIKHDEASFKRPRGWANLKLL